MSNGLITSNSVGEQSANEREKTDDITRDLDCYRKKLVSPDSAVKQQIPSINSEKNSNDNRESLGAFPQLNDRSLAGESVAEAVVKMLEGLGVKYAFGVSGGAIAPMWAALENSSIQVIHFRHESGATFAATEAYFASGDPVAVFTTAGPGITNALTGLFAARWEGAKVILISPFTSEAQRGRLAFQETSPYTMPMEGIFTSGTLFHYAKILEDVKQLSEVFWQLEEGLVQPSGFVAHISVPTAIQLSLSNVSIPQKSLSHSAIAPEKEVEDCAKILFEKPFAIWLGFGARGASDQIRELAQETGAVVMCSPRGKGIFPEDDPQFVGVTGFGGDASAIASMQEEMPERVLVLGTRLGEFTWSPAMAPSGEFIHVDLNPDVLKTVYPKIEKIPIKSDVKAFVSKLLKCLQKYPKTSKAFVKRSVSRVPKSRPSQELFTPCDTGLIRPEVLMQAIQRVVVDASDALTIAEAGNSFAWTTNKLRFTEPGRYRVSTGFGSMGHAVTGVLGAALVRNKKAVAIVGDGAMLMNGGDISTAVKYKISAVWVVLNDGRYNMCAQGMARLGFDGVDAEFPSVDFVQMAKSMGADGTRVERESELEKALREAMASEKPFVVDVIIDPTCPAPIGNRVQSLVAQGYK
ncbi:thiamine pyrophosphate-dependent enzyme [Aerosakkonema sp. BLCC-F183]|uniref:thiamine pyrophosphate-dependent enzyme n=1 Tax=Aerosakkonema sp. BLCC-F183 TaxID=3342834 RepID=UPI0035B6DE2C